MFSNSTFGAAPRMSRGSQLACRMYSSIGVGGGPGALQDADPARAGLRHQVGRGGDHVRVRVVRVLERQVPDAVRRRARQVDLDRDRLALDQAARARPTGRTSSASRAAAPSVRRSGTAPPRPARSARRARASGGGHRARRRVDPLSPRHMLNSRATNCDTCGRCTSSASFCNSVVTPESSGMSTIDAFTFLYGPATRTLAASGPRFA